jgi:hypothetical protein
MTMAMVSRIGLALVGLFFLLIAVRGILDPQFFTDTFGVVGEGAARNTLRADFGAFFCVGAIPAVWVALQPSKVRWLNISAAFLGAVLALRIFGVIMGDIPNIPGMIGEAISLVVIFAARKVLAQEP